MLASCRLFITNSQQWQRQAISFTTNAVSSAKLASQRLLKRKRTSTRALTSEAVKHQQLDYARTSRTSRNTLKHIQVSLRTPQVSVLDRRVTPARISCQGSRGCQVLSSKLTKSSKDIQSPYEFWLQLRLPKHVSCMHPWLDGESLENLCEDNMIFSSLTGRTLHSPK